MPIRKPGKKKPTALGIRASQSRASLDNARNRKLQAQARLLNIYRKIEVSVRRKARMEWGEHATMFQIERYFLIDWEVVLKPAEFVTIAEVLDSKAMPSQYPQEWHLGSTMPPAERKRLQRKLAEDLGTPDLSFSSATVIVGILLRAIEGGRTPKEGQA